jgi:hypothetical protein
MEKRKALIDIVSAIGVWLSVVYLSSQVNENTKQLRTQSHFNALSIGQRPLEMMLENKNVFDDIYFCNKNPENADEGRWERCSAYYLMLFNAWEYWFYQQQDNSIPSYLGVGADVWWKDLIKKNCGVVMFWEKNKQFFGESFGRYISNEFNSRACIK